MARSAEARRSPLIALATRWSDFTISELFLRRWYFWVTRNQVGPIIRVSRKIGELWKGDTPLVRRPCSERHPGGAVQPDQGGQGEAMRLPDQPEPLPHELPDRPEAGYAIPDRYPSPVARIKFGSAAYRSLDHL